MKPQTFSARYANMSIRTKIFIPFVSLLVLVTVAGSWAYLESQNVKSQLTSLMREREQLLHTTTSISGCLDGLTALMTRVTAMTQIVPAPQISEEYRAAQTCTADKIAKLKDGQLAERLRAVVNIAEAQIDDWFSTAAPVLGLAHGTAVPAQWIVDEKRRAAYVTAERLLLSVDALTADAENMMHEQWLSNMGKGLALLLLMLSVVLFSSIHQARTLIAPLIRIKNAAEAVAAGKPDAEFSETQRRDEIGDLSSAIHKMHETLESNVDQITKLAFGDALTGLANRACAQRDLVEFLSEGRKGKPFALIHLDLDNFKRINDTLGHAAGDDLLSTFGERLRYVVGQTSAGKAYRWGGDEFLVIVDNADLDLPDLCTELVDVLGIPVDCGGSEVHPTASLGVARYPEDGDSVDALMVYADIALYKAKESGRDGFHFFSAELKQKIDEEALIEREIREALAQRQFFLVYQPQVDVNTHKITGVESLLRWRHPEKGVLSPGHFLHVAEACRQAPELGRFILDEAMGATRQWVDAGLEFGRVAINASPQHVKSGTLYDDFTEAMARHGVAPQHLAAEVVESIILDTSSNGQASFIERLHNLGVHVELDDFGTGYASLSHLSTLPIDGLKIDKSFVDQMLTDEKIRVLVRSLVNMARLMQLSLVCEGIETQQQYEFMKECGSCSIQGYLFSRPMEFDEMTAWLQRSMKERDPATLDAAGEGDTNIHFLSDRRQL